MATHEAGFGKRFLTYTLTPGILPRVRELAGSGFSNLAYLMALVFNAVGILPANHPYLSRAAQGRYGIRHVIIEAQKNLTFTWGKIDQIIIFFAILAGIILLAMQFVVLVLMGFTDSAFAQSFPVGLAEIFEISAAQAQTDIAYRILDMVFGAPDIFGNHTGDGILPAYHTSLHNMYQIYSYGILVVAVLVLAYFVTAMIAETAHTGTPFGKRFNHAWAPLRLVAGIGLLIPMTAGFNSGQWIALHAARLGSNFATNGWVRFNEDIAATYLGEQELLVALPNSPEMMHLPAFMMIVHACNYAEEEVNDRTIDAYVVTPSNDAGEEALDFVGTDYATALEFSNSTDIYVRFGQRDTTYTSERGLVYPWCGELVFSTSTLDEEDGAYEIQEAYYEMARAWYGGGGGGCVTADLAGLLEQYAEVYGDYFLPIGGRLREEIIIGDDGLPPASFKEAVQLAVQQSLSQCILQAAETQRGNEEWEIDAEVIQFGWAGAAIWYNKVAQLNGTLASAVQSVPRITQYPYVMEYTMKDKMQNDDSINPLTRFSPQTEQGREVRYTVPGNEGIAKVLFLVQQYWENDGYRVDASAAHTQIVNNPLIDAINAALGTQGIFDMCRNTDIHPLAQLAMAGKTMIESSIRNLGWSVASGAAGGASYIFAPYEGAIGAAGSAAGFFKSVATIGLLVGFILFYVIPLMPFIYFFFAVGGWVKGLFEAMVGIPLWALAHIRIDGEGLPGDAAADGYYFIFEIFLRPILIVFGLIASILIFTAMVMILNDIFFVVISNLSGFNPENAVACGIENATQLERLNMMDYFRGPVDEFFFTIVYAMLVYMIGMSCFKLIDQVPNQILRWMGKTIKTFGDEAGEPAEGLLQKVAVGGGAAGREIQSGMNSLEQAGGDTAKFVADQKQKSDIEDKFG